MLSQITYFSKKPLLIPSSQSIPSISSNTPSNEDKLIDFIKEQEIALLKNILGIEVYTDLASYISETGLSVDAPEKYKDLVNGKTYDKDDNKYEWRGLLGHDGILANYIFCKWMESDLSDYTVVGIQASEAENSNRVSAIPMWVNAWRNFIKQYQNDSISMPNVIYSNGGYGIDWNGRSGKVSLYAFLNDSDDFDTALFVLEKSENSFGV